ncbi:hypothetical protein COY16_04050 [Candidatus Roizmanbacteria bacterium CG_4_10_14_0_2_um_filter_39_13]|uniref:Glycosyltransferase 2-like domain-containing protein n=1 Tax=Candidatus Roizmanbacteria bacterium CG_4_10_14_0_2_um_filter_39_13 TaxID=1974825 RepID=A0A2M7TXM2_9BACT|nr:MAG: hypothetical protein COY16_04050 [Candidatus Roizmanbacteria bacterium CG_4_10_14_0_2_um_filter_39_13]
MIKRPPLLTLTIPTYNEEKNIRLPLDSAYDLVDEVLIVDGGSTDKTVEIAKSYGPKVSILSVDNPPNFLLNKQRAIDNAKGDWILQLDADERLSPELRLEIRYLKSSLQHQTSNISGYWIPRKNWFLGRYLMKGGVYPDAVLRLYQREKAHFALKNVHEHAIVDGETKWTEHAIEHMADPTFERYIERWHRYNTFDANQLIQQGVRPCAPCYLIGKPIVTFLSIYIRHKGFMDGWPGFVWALFSSIRYGEIYFKATNQ